MMQNQHDIPISQSAPVYPGLQLHEYPLMASVQIPACRQGLLSHSSISEIYVISVCNDSQGDPSIAHDAQGLLSVLPAAFLWLPSAPGMAHAAICCC